MVFSDMSMRLYRAHTLFSSRCQRIVSAVKANARDGKAARAQTTCFIETIK